MKGVYLYMLRGVLMADHIAEVLTVARFIVTLLMALIWTARSTACNLSARIHGQYPQPCAYSPCTVYKRFDSPRQLAKLAVRIESRRAFQTCSRIATTWHLSGSVTLSLPRWMTRTRSRVKEVTRKAAPRTSQHTRNSAPSPWENKPPARALPLKPAKLAV